MIVGYKYLNEGNGKIREVEINKGIFQGSKRRVLDYEMYHYYNGNKNEFYALYWKKNKDGKKHYIRRSV